MRPKLSTTHQIRRPFAFIAPFIIAVTALPASANAAIYYVATAGDDTRSCATAQTITTPKKTIASGLACLTAGDTLDIRGGTYPEGFHRPTLGGTSAAPVTIRGHAGETVVLRKSGNIIQIASAANRYLVFDNLVVDGGLQTDIADAAITMYSSAGSLATGGGWNTFRNLAIRNAYSQGVIMSRFDNGHNLFQNVSMSNAGRCGLPACDFGGAHGFYIQSRDNVFDHLDVYDNWFYGMTFYSSWSDANISNNVIRNSTFHNNGRIGKGSHLGIQSGGSNNQVYNNVFHSGASNYGLVVQYGAVNTLVYNNTVTGQVLDGIYIGSGVTGTVVKNNIVYGNAGGAIQNNGVNTTLSNNLTTNPKFVNTSAGDFRLQLGSPAIDTGVQILQVTADLNGIPRPQGTAYDIGAHEYGSATAAPVPPAAPTNVRVVSGL